MIRAALLALFAAGAAAAQGTVETLDPGENPHGSLQTIDPEAGIVISPLTGEIITLPVPEAPRERVATAEGAVIRWLDKVSGEVRDIELSAGASEVLGRIEVALGECRFPPENPGGEAYAWLDIRTVGRERVDFSGWMLASSPALSALDHPRYDVWVIRCTTA